MMTYAECVACVDELRAAADREETISELQTGNDQLHSLIRCRDYLRATLALTTVIAEVERLRKCAGATAKALDGIGLPLAAKQIRDEIYAPL